VVELKKILLVSTPSTKKQINVMFWHIMPFLPSV